MGKWGNKETENLMGEWGNKTLLPNRLFDWSKQK